MPRHLGWHTRIYQYPNTQIFLKIIVWFLEAAKLVWGWSVLLHRLHTIWNSCSHVIFEGPQNYHEKESCFPHGFRCSRGCRRAFSQASSRMKALCDPELPWVGSRGLSTEIEHCLKVSSAQQILGIIHMFGLYIFNKWICKALFSLVWGRKMRCQLSQSRHFPNFWHTKLKRFANQSIFIMITD